MCLWEIFVAFKRRNISKLVACGQNLIRSYNVPRIKNRLFKGLNGLDDTEFLINDTKEIFVVVRQGGAYIIFY